MRLPKRPLQKGVKLHLEPYTIDRRQERDETVPGGGEEYEEGATTEELYLYDPVGGSEVVDVGSVPQGDLNGIALPSADIEVGDRISFGQGRYEIIEPIDPQPTESMKAILSFPLERV